MLPTDSYMLMSIVNTYLRDKYSSFDDLCDGEDFSEEEKEQIIARLKSIGYKYDESKNAFVEE